MKRDIFLRYNYEIVVYIHMLTSYCLLFILLIMGKIRDVTKNEREEPSYTVLQGKKRFVPKGIKRFVLDHIRSDLKFKFYIELLGHLL